MPDRDPDHQDPPGDSEDERLEDLRRFKVQPVPPGAREAWLNTKTPTLPPEQLVDTVPPRAKKTETVPYGTPLPAANEPFEPSKSPKPPEPAQPAAPPKSPEPPPPVVLSDSVVNQKRPRPEYLQTMVLPRRIEERRAKRNRLLAGFGVAAVLFAIAAIALFAAPRPPAPREPEVAAPPATTPPAPTSEAPATPAPASDPATPATVQSPQPIRAASTAWRITATFPVASNV